MLNILLTGVGGQGTVLAAKVLAQTAEDKGWRVRTAETIGMAQRGGSVVSHVRVGDLGEEVCSPLIPEGCADMIIAFEPSEGARCLRYLKPEGILVSAETGIPAVMSGLGDIPYSGHRMVERLMEAFAGAPDRLKVVSDGELLARVGSRRVLNTVLLASAVATGELPMSVDDLRAAVRECVKPHLVDINIKAIDLASEY